ncbi:MAG: hypothetical protein ABSD99_03675 [Candidatus Bathyarchaeia archaeon]|jgi:S-layer protein
MKATLAQQRLFAALFVTIAILSLTPALAHADQQSQPQTISLDMNGQATSIGNGLSGASTLKLTGNAYTNSNQWLVIQNVTGSLQIGSTTIQITGGQGSVKTAGATAIFADTNSGKGQLILIGTMNNNTATFNSPESQLASTSYLSLSGTVNESTGNLGTNPGNTNSNSTSLTTVSPNSTQTTNSTTMSSTVQLQNTTSVESVSMTTTTDANVTSSTSLNTSTNSTATGSSNIPPSAAQAPSNVTVTVTQYLNQTVSVTQTVANVTISYTVTSTVANTTITQANVTTTGNATTTATT